MMDLYRDLPGAGPEAHTGTGQVHSSPCLPQVFSKAGPRLWQQLELEALQRREGNR